MRARLLPLLFGALLVSACSVETDAARVLNGLADMTVVTGGAGDSATIVIPPQFSCKNYNAEFTSASAAEATVYSSTNSTITLLLSINIAFPTQATPSAGFGTALSVATDGSISGSAGTVGVTDVPDPASSNTDPTDSFVCKIKVTYPWDPSSGQVSGNGAVIACDTVYPCLYRNIYVDCGRLTTAMAKYGC